MQPAECEGSNMPMGVESKISMRRTVIFLVGIAITVFVLMSAAIAINTVDKCGSESAPKHWNFFPPEWVCERPNFGY